MTEITDDFFNLKLKEFKIYWIERGQKKNNWNSTFIDFIRREWAKETNSKKTIPHIIDENWYPDSVGCKQAWEKYRLFKNKVTKLARNVRKQNRIIHLEI